MKKQIAGKFHKAAADISKRTQRLIKHKPTMALYEIQRIEKELKRVKKTLHL